MSATTHAVMMIFAVAFVILVIIGWVYVMFRLIRPIVLRSTKGVQIKRAMVLIEKYDQLLEKVSDKADKEKWRVLMIQEIVGAEINNVWVVRIANEEYQKLKAKRLKLAVQSQVQKNSIWRFFKKNNGGKEIQQESGATPGATTVSGGSPGVWADTGAGIDGGAETSFGVETSSSESDADNSQLEGSGFVQQRDVEVPGGASKYFKRKDKHFG